MSEFITLHCMTSRLNMNNQQQVIASAKFTLYHIDVLRLINAATVQLFSTLLYIYLNQFVQTFLQCVSQCCVSIQLIRHFSTALIHL